LAGALRRMGAAVPARSRKSGLVRESLSMTRVPVFCVGWGEEPVVSWLRGVKVRVAAQL
jgi:hypothetical protein